MEKPPKYQLANLFWKHWEDHDTPGDPKEIVEMILSMPLDRLTRVYHMPGPVPLVSTVMEARIGDRNWALIAHRSGTDTWYVFQLQPRG